MKISQKMGSRITRFYDATLCSDASVQRQAAALKKVESDRKISVAIAHYNRGSRIHLPLRNILADPRVSEVVIMDDASLPEEYEALCRNVNRLDVQKKVRVIRSEINRGAMRTKYACIGQVSNDWVILLDSDNTIFQNYLRTIFQIPQWDPQVTYCPGWAFPYFSFRPLVGPDLTFDRCVELSRQRVLHRVFLMNDGNYFFNRDAYLETLRPLGGVRNDVADVIVANYLWLSAGKRLQVLEGAAYCHRIDPSSFWMRTKDDSRVRLMSIYERLDQNLRWDEDFALRLADAVVR